MSNNNRIHIANINTPRKSPEIISTETRIDKSLVRTLQASKRQTSRTTIIITIFLRNIIRDIDWDLQISFGRLNHLQGRCEVCPRCPRGERRQQIVTLPAEFLPRPLSFPLSLSKVSRGRGFSFAFLVFWRNLIREKVKRHRSCGG